MTSRGAGGQAWHRGQARSLSTGVLSPATRGAGRDSSWLREGAEERQCQPVGGGALRGLDATQRNRATVKPVFLGTLGLAPEKKQQWLCGGAKARKDRKRKGFFRRRVVR